MVAEGGWSPRRVHCESTAVAGSGRAAGRWSPVAAFLALWIGLYLYDQSFPSRRWARFCGCVNLKSRRNPSSRSASFPIVEEKKCSFSPHAVCTEKSSLVQVGIWNKHHSPKIYIKCRNRKNMHDQNAIWNLYPSPKIYMKCWDATDIAKRRVNHHPFCHFLSRVFTTDGHFNAYITLWSAVLQQKNCEPQRKFGTILYRTEHERMVSRTRKVLDHGTATVRCKLVLEIENSMACDYYFK